ncbi:HERC1 [Symbiodinium sp. CCMP2592]|nr:HERC1 [Symbiodinium sp. CCMP2592]
MGHASSSCCANDEKQAVEDIQACINGLSVATTQPPATSSAAAISSTEITCVDTVPKKAVDLTYTASSLSLLRGVFLRKTLQGGGGLWRRNPTTLTHEQLAVNFATSEQVQSLDVFFSHSWLTPGRWKFLSLLVRNGWPYMLAAWAIGTALACVGVLLGVLPLMYEWEFLEGEVISMSFWANVAGVFSSTGGLLLFPYICGKDRRCFLDCACIDQTDQARMQAGIRSIGGFLQAAEELHVLWSEPYLTRLWCVFELAAYQKLNPSGKVTIAPVFVEVIVCLLFVYLHIASWFFVAIRTSALGRTIWIWIALACFGGSLFPLVHALRHICTYKQVLLTNVGNFQFETLACANESDRDTIREAIVRWYGSEEAFSEFVRSSFRKVVHDSVKTPGGMPFGYVCLLATPMLNAHLDRWISLLRAGSPVEAVWAYFSSALLAVSLAFYPAVIGVGLYACDRWARDWSCRPVAVLQTVGIGLAIWILFSLGTITSSVAYRGSETSSLLLWIGAAFLFAFLMWRCLWQQRGPCTS